MTRAVGSKSARLAVLWLLLLLCATAALAQPGLITREEALAAVYPGAAVEAERVFLTRDQIRRAAELARVEINSPLVARYVARRSGTVVGRAYVDTHVVRTKRESLLVALAPDGSVRRVEITAFLEPLDYLAPEPWLRQFDGQNQGDEVALQRAIRPIAGATLTARSATEAVRRVMAIDEVLMSEEQAAR